MAGLFKTGQELQQERMVEMAAANAKAQAPSTSAMGRGGNQLGFALGALLGSKLAGTKDAAGDVDISSFDLGSSKGNIEAARTMREAGFEEEAQKLEDRGIKMYTYESKLASDAAALSDDATDWMKRDPNPTQTEVEGFALHWTGRDDTFGEMSRKIIDEKDPQQMANFTLMNRLAKTQINQLYNEMRAKGVIPNPVLLERAFVDTLAESGSISDESWFGGVFGTSPVIDQNKMKDTLTAATNAVRKSFMEKPKTAEDATVTPGEPTPTTKAPTAEELAADESGRFDVQGKIEPETPADPGTKMESAIEVGYRDPIPANISGTDKQKLMDIDRKIDKYSKDPTKKKLVESLMKNRLQVYKAATRGK